MRFIACPDPVRYIYYRQPGHSPPGRESCKVQPGTIAAHRAGRASKPEPDLYIGPDRETDTVPARAYIYQNYRIPAGSPAYKPNIYIYILI